MGFSRRIFALPLIVLALLMQLGAPAAAAEMAAAMVNPFAAMPICSVDHGKRGAGGEHDPAHHHDMGECPLCAACAPVHAAPTATVQQVRPSLFPVRIERQPSPGEAAPRGPPRLAPRARAPPLNA